MRIRILPLTMLTAGAVMGLKLADAVQGGTALSRGMLVQEARAQNEKKADTPAADAKAETQPTNTAPAEVKSEGKSSDPAPTEAKTDATKTEAEKPVEKKDGEGKDAPSSAPPPNEKKSMEGGEKNPTANALTPTGKDNNDTIKRREDYSTIELDLLQNLSKRREELEQWSKELEVKENLLSATEKRIDQKLDKLQTMKKQLDGLLVTYNEKEESKIKSLVKIYENMKPKDAARIFEQLDMTVLLEVVDKMGERKVAPVLAAMDPKKAMQVTTELAEQRRLNTANDLPPGATTTSQDSASAANASTGQTAGGTAPATSPAVTPNTPEKK